MVNAEILRGKDGDKWIKITLDRSISEIRNTLNSLDGILYSRKTGVWALPYRKLDEFESKLGNYLIVWKDKEGANNGGIPEETISAYPIVEGYSVEYNSEGDIISHEGFKTRPWGEFQVKGFNAMVERDFLILADDAGLGKTFMVATAMEARKKLGHLERGVVVVRSTLLYNWRDEIRQHTNLRPVVVAGTPKERYQLFSDLGNSDDWDVLIISYDMFRISIKNLELLDNYKPLHFCVVDEAHVIKNPNSKIGSAIRVLPFTHKYVLTATPLPNTPLEAYNYLKFGKVIDINYWKFEHHFAIKGGYRGKEIIGYKNILQLKDLIQSNMLRRRKKDKLKELPDVTFNRITLKMSPYQSRLYNAVKKGIEEDLKDTTLESIPSALAKITRLQQITVTTQLIDNEDVKSQSVKFEALDQLLEDLIDVGREKVIIFSSFREAVLILEERYSKYNPAVVHGDISSTGITRNNAVTRLKRLHGEGKWNSLSSSEKETQIEQLTTSDRQRQVHKFQGDDSCKVFIGSAKACREGLTLTKATHVVFLDCEPSPAYVEQAYSRAHRIGQKNVVTVHYLICEDTIDEHVHDILTRKEGMAYVMLDDGQQDLRTEGARRTIARLAGIKV